jgi:hypothetical protein
MKFLHGTMMLVSSRSNAIPAVGTRRWSIAAAIPSRILTDSVTDMLDSANEFVTHLAEKEPLAASNECSVEAVAILEELLAQSILLRNLYKIARWQTCNGELCRMHQLFDGHYKEQLHLVDRTRPPRG